jgi:CHAT domain-containing protein/large exoprotein involved in heme utilization and adhesion
VESGAEGNAGGVTIETGSLEVINGTGISSSTFGIGDAGSVNITASDTVVFDGESSEGFPSGAFSDAAEGAEGNAGGVTIETGSLEVINGAEISSSTFGIGDAGSVNITASDTVVFDGESSEAFPSGAFSSVESGAEGNAGGVTIETGSLEVINGAAISSGSFGIGDAGSVRITASESVALDGESSKLLFPSGVFSSVQAGGEGNAGGVTIETGSLTVTNGAKIGSDTFGIGDAGSVNIRATNTVIFDGESSNGFPSGAFSSVQSGAEGNAGGVKIETGFLAVTNGAVIDASTFGIGDAGSINITTPLINIDGGDISAFTETTGNAGDIFITSPETLNISGSGEITATTSSSGNAGIINILTQNLTLSNGADITASTTGAGNAGAVNLQADRIDIRESSQILAFTEGSGAGGNITVRAPEALNLDANTKLSVETSSPGRAGNIAIAANEINIGRGAEISARATATSTNTEDGGNISINTSQLNITGQLGIFAETAGEADAGTLTINPYNNNQDLNITFSNDGFISASTSSTGNGGNINIYAPESISITGDGNIFVQTTGVGNAGSIEIETDNLTIADNTSISASTEGAGNAGVINIETETFTLERGTSLTTETDSAGQAGNIEITSRELTISDNAQISATARSGATSKQPGGNITINASDLLISGELGIFAETAGDAEAGTLALNPRRNDRNLNITFANDGFISARTTSTGNGGNINITAPRAINISGEGFISVETKGEGNAGTINIDTQNLTLTGGVAISAETNSPGTAGNININSQNVTIGEGTSISATAREASTATEAGGNISINASELLISGELGIFAETAGESPAGTLNLNSHNSNGNLKITFTNDGFISARTTSTGNGGNINIFAPDSIEISGDGRVTVESRGAGNAGNIEIETRNLSIADRTTISAATFNGGGDGGSININPSGTFRLIGSILTETRGAGEGGNIAINTGNLIAPNSTISARSTGGGNAGNINITTVGNAITGIVTSSANNREQAADGGNIEIVSEGSFIEATQPIQSFSNQGNAGNVTLQAQTDVTTNTISSHGQQQGGEISITATTGNIDTSNGSLTNYSGGGTAGNVSLEAPNGSITTSDIYSYANQDGGNISVNAGGDINIIENSNIITASEPSTTAEEASGRGGDIILNAGGNINTIAAQIYSGADDGDTGTVEITGESNIQLGQIDLASGFVRERLEINDNFTLIPRPEGPATSGVAGNITITSNNGTIDTSAGTINSRSPDGSGNITINAQGDITTGNLSASALNPETPTRGGDIEIISRQGEINATQQLETFSERGTAGNVTLTAEGSIRTETILSQGTQRGGDINIDSRSENSIEAAGALNTYSTEGTAGNVTLASPGSITLSGIRSEGMQRGGSISVTSEVGQINSTGDIDSFSESGVGGNVELNASRDVNIANVSSYGLTQSGDLLIQSQTAGVNAGNVTTQAPGGDSGSIVINGQTVGTGDLSSIGTTSAGAIDVEATDGSIATYDVEVRSDGTAGAITLRATEDVTTDDINQEAGEGDVNIDIDSGGDQNIGDINQVAEEGDANIGIDAGGNQTIGNINQTAGGDATNVQTAGGNQTIGNINQTAGGDATNVQTAGGNQTIGNINQTAGGDATNVQTAGGNQTIGNINQTAGGNATNVQTAGGNQTIGNINQTAGGNAVNVQTAGGNQTIGIVTQDAGNDAINVQTAGGTQNLEVVNQTFGNESINIQNPGVTQNLQITPNNNTSTVNIGDFNTDSQGAIATNDSLSNNSSIQNAVIGISNPQSGNNSSSSIANTTSDTQQTLETISTLNSSPMAVPANTETLALLEESRNQDFADYLGLDLYFDQNAIENVRAVLSDMNAQTGQNSAVVYINIYADELQVILYTAEEEAILKTLPGVKREEVIETVEKFRANIVTSLRFPRAKTYLPPAQQLYRWLIAPIAAELASANIDTLLFSMDEGLRGLPLAALHDGEQFLIERYSLSMIPSISLVDSRYRSVKDARVLAMGASQFTELNPLPAVPVELETITTELWQGNAFIDEKFTLSNLIAQRQQYSYPIIHLATHGEFKAGDASNSYIQFWGEEKLALDRVRELGLNNPPVELLVLSACRTAVGDSNAELGFAGLAVAAGVKSAVASLWYVSDEGTLGLMLEFYSRLDDVTIKAEALRQAQLAMLRGEVEVTEGQLRGSSRGAVVLPSQLANIENNNLSHPYYWSGFTTIGSPW